MGSLVLLNNFLHDFSAAAWLVGAVVAHIVLKHAGRGTDPGDALPRVLKTVLLMMRLSVLGIVVCGLLRALAYSRYEWSEAAGHSQVWLLAVKHIVFTAVFGLGCIPYVRAARFVRRHHEEKE